MMRRRFYIFCKLSILLPRLPNITLKKKKPYDFLKIDSLFLEMRTTTENRRRLYAHNLSTKNKPGKVLFLFDRSVFALEQGERDTSWQLNLS